MSPARMLSKVFRQMDDAIDLCHPKALVYIAMDGVAPRVKMNEQRVRRYANQRLVSSEMSGSGNSPESQVPILEPVPTEFFLPSESVAITPGTKFMKAASEAVRFYIYQRLNGRHRNLQMIFNDSSVPGEGEHKLFQFMRAQRFQPRYKHNSSHVVCGSDADFIMYALMSHEPNICVLRSVCQNENVLLRIDRLRKHIVKDMIPKGTITYNEGCVVEDFVLISMLLGNDFLPKLNGVGTAVSVLMKVYREIFPELGGYIAQKDKEINIGRLLKYIEHLGKVQVTYGQTVMRISERINRHRKFDSSTNVDMANNYIKTICWAFKYYSGVDCPSWHHFYPYHFPPSISYILKSVNPDTFNQKFVADNPMLPFEQLMCVIPPSCAYLLPEPFRFLVIDKSSPVKEYFPEAMEIRSGVGILPFIDESRVIAAMAPCYEKLSAEDAKRNLTTGKVHLFSGLRSSTYPALEFLERKTDVIYTLPRDSTISGILHHDEPKLSSIVTPIKKWGNIQNNQVLNAEYKLLAL